MKQKKFNSKKNYCNAKGREILKRKIKKSKKLTASVLVQFCSYYSLQHTQYFSIKWLQFFCTQSF